jgi:hypothetical protein
LQPAKKVKIEEKIRVGIFDKNAPPNVGVFEAEGAAAA